MNLQEFFESLDGAQQRVRQLPADFRPADTSPQLAGPYPGRNATRGYLVGEDQDMAEGLLNEFDPGEGGFGPFKVYIGKQFVKQFSTFEEAKDEVDFLRDSDPRSANDHWRIVDGTGQTAWEYDIGNKIDSHRRSQKFRGQGMSEQQGVAEGSLNEYRDRLLQYVKNLLPTWPEYILKDWLVPNKGDFSNLPDTELKNGIMEKLKLAGLSPNTKWQLVPNMQFTMDMFEPMTTKRLIGRAGGHSDMGLDVPRDKERHATQAQLVQREGGVRKEPVILIKTVKGYELLEGWHRTIQHFAKYPQGYMGPAYVAVAQGQQGVAERALNELDIMAPRTTYFRMGDGQYVKADYRASGGSDSVPSFVKFQWVDPKTAQQLNLDQILATPDQASTLANEPGRRQIASPTGIQSGGPLSQRNIDVIDTRNPPEHHSSGLKSKLATWITQQQGVSEGQFDQQRIKFRGTDHDIGEERYVFAIDGNPLVFNFASDEDDPDPDSPSFKEILARVQRDGAVEHLRVTPAEQQAMAKKIAAERQRYLDQRRPGVAEGSDPSFIVTFDNTLSNNTYTALVKAMDEYDAKDIIKHHGGRGTLVKDVKPARGNERTDYIYRVFKDTSSSPAGQAGLYPAEQGVAEGLDEAVGGNYLYHSRSKYDVKDILASGYIPKARGPQTVTQAQTALPTVSITRDWGYASGSNAQSQTAGIGRDVVFVLDRNAVESNFKTLGTSQSTHIKGLALNPYLKKDGEARSQNTDQLARDNAKAKSKYAEPTAKAGGEFEEAVVVPKGVLPLKGTMVGFWVNPKSELMNDPAIMDDPRRLDMVRPNQFVKANQQTPSTEKPMLTPAQKKANQKLGREKSIQMAKATQQQGVREGVLREMDRRGFLSLATRAGLGTIVGSKVVARLESLWRAIIMAGASLIPHTAMADPQRLVVLMNDGSADGKKFDITDFEGANDREKMRRFNQLIDDWSARNPDVPQPNYRIFRGDREVGRSQSIGNSSPSAGLREFRDGGGGFDPDESADSLRRSRKIQGLEESGWNPLDDERRQQRAMDQERERFRRDELEAELSGEEERYRQIMRGTWYVIINGRAWQRQGQPVTFQGREAARRAAQTIKNRSPEKTVAITQTLPTTEQTDPRQRLAQMRAQTQSSLQAMRANAQAGRDRMRGGAPAPAAASPAAPAAPAAAPPAASPGRTRKTNATGVTQHDWMAQARRQGARLIQAKMIDGVVIAIYPDGRRDAWQPVGESVSESVKQHHFIYETHERMFKKWDAKKEREEWEARKAQYVQQAMDRDEKQREYERQKKEKEAQAHQHSTPGQEEFIAPHGDARNEVAMFQAGNKPAALINSPDVGIWSDLINSGRYVLQRLKLAGQPDSYVIGQPGEEERVEKIHALVQNANDRAQQGDFSPFQNSNYHRWLGRLLGYPASKIEQFISNYFRDTPDRAQARYDEGQALQEIQQKLSQQIAAEDVLGGMRQRLGDMIQAKAAQRARQMARRQPPQDVLGDPVRRIDLGDGKILEIHGSEDDGFRIYRGTRGMPTRFRTLDEAMMAADLYEGWRNTLPEKKDPDLRRTARSTRIMQQLRARHPEAQNDIEALLYDFRAGQAQDRRDITRLDIELDDEEAEIDRIQADLNRLMRARKLDANIRETKKDACYQKVKSRYRVWPSAYASGALVQCRKQGARNWGTGKK